MNTKLMVLNSLKESELPIEEKIKIFNEIKGKTNDEVEQLTESKAELAGFIIGAILGLPLGNYLGRKMKNIVYKCNHLKGEPQRICRIKGEMALYNNTISKLRSGFSKCKKNKNPMSCQKAIQRSIDSLQNRVNKMKAGKSKKPSFMTKHFSVGSGGDF